MSNWFDVDKSGLKNIQSEKDKFFIVSELVSNSFDEDIKVTLDECTYLYEDFYTLPEEAQLIIANMMFNLGRPRLSKFKGMKAGVDARDWKKAANEMVDSAWYRQVPNRANRLVNRMKALV